MTFIPIIDPDGGFVEPTGEVFTRLGEMDWQDPRVQRDRKLEAQKLEDARAKRETEERRERDEDVYERFVAGNRTFVSMDQSASWSQNVNGRRGAGA